MTDFTVIKTMIENNQWAVDDDVHTLVNINCLQDKLDASIYKIFNTMEGLKLRKTSNSFSLPSRLYGLETRYIELVAKTWESRISKNMGALSSGLKGTGKTVSFKQLCNQLQLPVILVSSCFDGLTDFIEKIPQDVIIFIDEFEKVFVSKDIDEPTGSVTKLLSAMDGVDTNPYRRLYLLTSNSLKIDANLLNRPGRVLFHKKFSDLNEEAIVEIVDDLLVYKEHRSDCINTIGKLQTKTVDTITSLVNQVNLHNLAASKILPYLNLDLNPFQYSVTIESLDEENRSIVVRDLGTFIKANVSEVNFTKEKIGDNFYLNRNFAGEIIEVVDSTRAVIQLSEDSGSKSTRRLLGIENIITKDEDGDEVVIEPEFKYIVKVENIYLTSFSRQY